MISSFRLFICVCRFSITAKISETNIRPRLPTFKSFISIKKSNKVSNFNSPFNSEFYLLGLSKKYIKLTYDLDEYLLPINVAEISNDTAYNDSQMASVIKINEEEIPDLNDIDIVIVGINEFRGNGESVE